MLFPRLGMSTLKSASTFWWMFCSPSVIRPIFLSKVLGGSTLGTCTFGASRGVDDGGGVTVGCSCACWSAGGRTVGLEIGRAPRLNSSHLVISYAVFCLKKKT